jgi:hypothetical protein
MISKLNSTEESPLEAKTRSICQEFPRILRLPKSHCYVHAILSQMNPVNSLISDT